MLVVVGRVSLAARGGGVGLCDALLVVVEVGLASLEQLLCAREQAREDLLDLCRTRRGRSVEAAELVVDAVEEERVIVAAFSRRSLLDRCTTMSEPPRGELTSAWRAGRR